jgi:prophage DNA circulation protein
MSEIKIVLEAGAEFQSIAKANEQLKEMSTILTQMKDTKLALSGAESVANVQKLTAETKKLEQQVDALKTKSAAAAEKEKKALADQSGLLGQLIQKKKQLQGSLVGAKTIDDVQRINKEIANTNQEVLRLKTTGVSSFNSFEKAITSFQFKFNFLGNLLRMDWDFFRIN